MATPIAEAVIRVRADTSTLKADVEDKTADALGAAKTQAGLAEKQFAKLVLAQRDAIVTGTKMGFTNEQAAVSATELLIATRELAKQEYIAARALGAEGAAAAEAAFANFQLADAQIAAAASAGQLGTRSAGAGMSLGRLGTRFGLIGIAATAAFQGINEVQDSLKVTGEEAFTTEGRLRNAGAELIGGDLIGGIKALVAESSKLDWTKFITGTERSVAELTLFATESRAAAAAAREHSEALIADAAAQDVSNGRRRIAIGALQEEAASYRDNAAAAAFYAAAAQRAADIDAYWASIKFNRERDQTLRNPPGPDLKREAALIEAQGAGDLAAVKALQEAELARDEKELGKTTSIKRRNELILETARDRAAIAGTAKAIKAENDAAAKQAAADAKTAKTERERKLKEEREAAKEEREAKLKAIKDTHSFTLEGIRNRQATAALDEKVTARDITLKKQEIAFLKKLANDKKNYTRAERQEFTKARIAAQADLRDLRNAAAGSGGLTAESLFQTAVANFGTFGSNIAADWGGVLSPQDARGALAGSLLAGKKTTSTSAGRSAGSATNNPVATVIAQTAQAESQRSSKILVELQTQTGLLRKIAGSTRNLSVGINGGRVVNAQGTEWVGPRRY